MNDNELALKLQEVEWDEVLDWYDGPLMYNIHPLDGRYWCFFYASAKDREYLVIEYIPEIYKKWREGEIDMRSFQSQGLSYFMLQNHMYTNREITGHFITREEAETMFAIPDLFIFHKEKNHE